MRKNNLPMLAAVAGLWLGAISCTPQPPVALQSAPPRAPAAAIAGDMDASVASYRKIIVLMNDASALDEGNRQRVRTAAWILFEKNRDRLDQLEEGLRADAARSDSPLVASFLDRLENNSDFRDADKLAFRDLLDDLAAAPATEMPSASLRQRISDDAAVLEKIQALYQAEVSQIFSGLQTRGMTFRREVWFVQASSLQQNVALYANNAGFAFFRMGRYDDAVKWFLQTIALDPKRAVAYLNLGDAYLNLQKKTEARDAFEEFLVLSPNSKNAPNVREKLKSLS